MMSNRDNKTYYTHPHSKMQVIFEKKRKKFYRRKNVLYCKQHFCMTVCSGAEQMAAGRGQTGVLHCLLLTVCSIF